MWGCCLGRRLAQKWGYISYCDRAQDDRLHTEDTTNNNKFSKFYVYIEFNSLREYLQNDMNSIGSHNEVYANTNN